MRSRRPDRLRAELLRPMLEHEALLSEKAGFVNAKPNVIWKMKMRLRKLEKIYVEIGHILAKLIQTHNMIFTLLLDVLRFVSGRSCLLWGRSLTSLHGTCAMSNAE